MILSVVLSLISLPLTVVGHLNQHSFDSGRDESIASSKILIKEPQLCDDGTKQYSGYVPGSPLFFWFFESRSEPLNDPISLWLNGGPGSSSLAGMDYVGPCVVFDEGNEQGPKMKRRELSWNRNSSILMIDNPKGTGFSEYPFPASHSTYTAAVDLYDFLQSFFRLFPQYSQHELAINTLSYGGHYAPIYSAYILYRNGQLSGDEPLFKDWDRFEAYKPTEDDITLNLRSISIGNPWFGTKSQLKTRTGFACGGVASVPMLLSEAECEWSNEQWETCEAMLPVCEGTQPRPQCGAVTLFCEAATSYHYTAHGYNPYDYRSKTLYSETLINQFYNNVEVQIELGVATNASSPTRWDAHTRTILLEFHMSGDFLLKTDNFIQLILKTGVDILICEGMVDWICNFAGVRDVMSSLPSYPHQKAFNNLTYTSWEPLGEKAGSYKCLQGGLSDVNSDGTTEGKLCYLEIEDAGHIVALNKPKEAAWMISNWVKFRGL